MTKKSYEVTDSKDPGVLEDNVESNPNNANRKSIEDGPEVEVLIDKGDQSQDNTVHYPHGWCSRAVEKAETAFYGFCRRHRKKIALVLKIVLFVCYMAYFGYAVHYRYHEEGAYILTVITAGILLKLLIGRLRGTPVRAKCVACLSWYGTSPRVRFTRIFFRYGLYIMAVAMFCTYMGLNMDSFDGQTGQALLGIFCLIGLCFLFSVKPSQVNWHPVFWGFMIQFAFATITLRTEIGYNIFKWIGDVINSLVRLSDKGSVFVFGASYTADGAGFFFDCAGVIIFFNSCIFLLEYYGILEFVVLKIGGALALCLETGPVESVVAAANIFIGLSEAPLLVRPYLPTVTKSELHAIMVCGFSSISGAFMAMFIKVGAPASHLLTAAVISAPAALAITKLMYPETEKVDVASQKRIKMSEENTQRNALQCFSDGASFSIKLVACIMVNMIAFVSLLNLMNTVLIWVGDRVGIENMTFAWLCSYGLYPLAYLMGVPPADCGKLGSLIGIKLVATPFVAYADLGEMIQNRLLFEDYLATSNGTWHYSGQDVILDEVNTTLTMGFMTERSEVITTYALCGISAFPAIGFSMGTLIPMCPPRKGDVVSLIGRAFLAGNLANIVTGAVAGVMFTSQT